MAPSIGADPGIRRFACLATVALVVEIDQLAKELAPRVHAAAVLPAHNPGFVTGWAPVSTRVVALLSALVVVAFVAVVGRWAVQIGIAPCIPALVAGGMLAHALDRFRFGSVRDFIATPWLIVDVADVAVALGLVALVVAFARRAWQLHNDACTITLELPSLRAVVVAGR